MSSEHGYRRHFAAPRLLVVTFVVGVLFFAWWSARRVQPAVPVTDPATVGAASAYFDALNSDDTTSLAVLGETMSYWTNRPGPLDASLIRRETFGTDDASVTAVLSATRAGPDGVLREGVAWPLKVTVDAVVGGEPRRVVFEMYAATVPGSPLRVHTPH